MNEADQLPGAMTLGAHLRQLRRDRKLTLRDVEDATGRDVSNAYLSQVENGRKPSPDVLQSLADAYGVSYTALMTRAGYLKSGDAPVQVGVKHGSVATFAGENLTPDEERAMVAYLRQLREAGLDATGRFNPDPGATRARPQGS
jgi:transcriptional regulator with XRE-family HTH domain